MATNFTFTNLVFLLSGMKKLLLRENAIEKLVQPEIMAFHALETLLSFVNLRGHESIQLFLFVLNSIISHFEII